MTAAPSRYVPVLAAPGPGTEYRLSDLLTRHRQGDTVFLTDAVLNHRGPTDPLLYTAHRNVLAPRQAGGSRWFADLVEYQPGTLPGGELNRSTGHWNTRHQLEIFQVLTGTVLMLCAWHDRAGRPVLTLQTCPAETLTVIPFGGWHLTLVLDGPAAVFNIYTELPTGTPPQHSSDRDKYRRASPVELTAIRTGSGFTVTGPARPNWGVPQRVWEPAWLGDVIPDADLPALFQATDPAGLYALATQARRLVPTCHRRDPR